MEKLKRVMAAVQQAAHEFGVDLLADQLGMNPAVLGNQLNPNNSAHKLGFEVALRIVSITRNAELRDAIRDAMGAAGTLAWPDEAEQGGSLLEATLVADAENSDVTRTVVDAMRDGRIDSGEARRIAFEAAEAKDALDRVVARAFGAVGKAVH